MALTLRSSADASTTSIEALSDELLDRIFSFIDIASSLASLVRVSKRIHRLGLPHLYAEITFEGALIDVGIKYLLPFTYLMFKQPSLAFLVQSLSIRHIYAEEAGPFETPEGDNNHFRRKSWPDDPELDVILRDRVRAAALDEEEEETWFSTVKGGMNETAVLALLLPSLQNLRRLDIPTLFELAGGYLLRMMRRVSTRQKPHDTQLPFTKLSDIMIAGYSDKYPNMPDYLAACVGFPSVERLYGYNMGSEDDTDEVTEAVAELQPPRSSPIQYIELRMSKIYAEDLILLLQAPKALKTLIYEIGNSWAWCPVKTRSIQQAFVPLQMSLENLLLDHHDFYCFNTRNGGVDELTPMTFVDFKALKEIRIAPVFLFGDDVLQLDSTTAIRRNNLPPFSREEIETNRSRLVEAIPVSLEVLHFKHCRDLSTLRLLSACLQTLLNSKKDFPSLRKLVFEGSFKHDAELHSEIRDVLQLAQSQGLETMVINESVCHDGSSVERNWGWDEEIVWKYCQHNCCTAAEVLEASPGVVEAVSLE